MAGEFTKRGAPLTSGGLEEALGKIGGPAPAILWTVLAVETSGAGYLADRRPKILFERHIFSHLTHGRFDAAHPEISGPWDRHAYGASGAHQYDRLQSAIALDRDAALQSASWGLGQILGSNHAAAGFDTAEEMVAAFVASEDAQLMGMAKFIAASPMCAALVAQDWAGFARRYNGPKYAENKYDQHLAGFHALYAAHGCPNVNVRAAQVLLSYLNDGVGIDGVMGGHTADALRRFQKTAGLPQTGLADEATLAALAAA